jgi:hypothetical protein
MGAKDHTRRPMSAAHLAARLNMSARNARRIWAEPRAQFEARSISRQRPWEVEGVSRATWYRRRRRPTHAPS